VDLTRFKLIYFHFNLRCFPVILRRKKNSILELGQESYHSLPKILFRKILDLVCTLFWHNGGQKSGKMAVRRSHVPFPSQY